MSTCDGKEGEGRAGLHSAYVTKRSEELFQECPPHCPGSGETATVQQQQRRQV